MIQPNNLLLFIVILTHHHDNHTSQNTYKFIIYSQKEL